jgi:hypothetical protein
MVLGDGGTDLLRSQLGGALLARVIGLGASAHPGPQGFLGVKAAAGTNGRCPEKGEGEVPGIVGLIALARGLVALGSAARVLHPAVQQRLGFDGVASAGRKASGVVPDAVESPRLKGVSALDEGVLDTHA